MVTDRKLVVAVMSKKELAKLASRVQQFHLRIMSCIYSCTIGYIPVNKLVLAATLMRASFERSQAEVENAPVVCKLSDSLAVTERQSAE